MKYEIKGGNLPVVEVYLDANESINCENGAMVWMTHNMKMETSGGGIGKMFARSFSGERMFQNTYTAEKVNGMIAFGTNFPGSIVAMEIRPGQELICQKGAYLASTTGVNMEIFFQKKMSTGFFGGEGFIMQKMTGSGIVFLEIDGATVEHTLDPGEKLVIDTGYLAYMDSTCDITVEAVKGTKNALLGGEGFFNTVVTGPGRVVLQTIPKAQVAASLGPYLGTSS